MSFRVFKMVSNCLTRTCNKQPPDITRNNQKHIHNQARSVQHYKRLGSKRHRVARRDGLVLGAKTYHLVFGVHDKFPHLFQGSQPAVPVVLPRHPPQKIGEPRLIRMSLRSVWECERQTEGARERETGRERGGKETKMRHLQRCVGALQVMLKTAVTI